MPKTREPYTRWVPDDPTPFDYVTPLADIAEEHGLGNRDSISAGFVAAGLLVMGVIILIASNL